MSDIEVRDAEGAAEHCNVCHFFDATRETEDPNDGICHRAHTGIQAAPITQLVVRPSNVCTHFAMMQIEKRKRIPSPYYPDRIV